MDQAGRVRHERRAAPRNPIGASTLAGGELAAVLVEPAVLAACDVRVLLIEPDASIEAALRESGYDLCVTHDGHDVIASALAVRPDVVVCDIDSPQHDPWQLAVDFRGDPAFRHTALVALSAASSAHARNRALEAGFDAHLVKPAEPVRLHGVLAEMARLPQARPR